MNRSSTRRTRLSLLIWLGGLVMGSWMIAGCSASSEISDGALPQFSVPSDISPHQTAVFLEYQQTGEVSFSDYQVAMSEFAVCLEDQGFEIENYRTESLFGRVQVQFEAAMEKNRIDSIGEAGVDALYDECWRYNSSLVVDLYFNTGQTVEEEEQAARMERVKDEYLPLIVACLAENGVTVSENATFEEVGIAAIDLSMVDNGSGPDCLTLTGYTDAAVG